MERESLKLSDIGFREINNNVYYIYKITYVLSLENNRFKVREVD